MLKSQLIRKVHETNPHLSKQDVNRIVDVLFDYITKSLSDNQRVEVRGFGVFGVKEQKARLGRNPRTGKQVSIPPKKSPYFRVGKELRYRLNKPEVRSG
jgi:integration host factor subunit beta